MNAQFLSQLGQPARIPAGGREVWELWGAGPASYVQATGDVISSPSPGSEFLTCVCGAVMSVSGTYILYPKPSVSNSTRPSWTFHWYVASTGLEVAGATNLSAETVQFAAIGGQF